MSNSDFEYLVKLVGPKIARRHTNYRKAISVPKRLALTLRFFATGDSFDSVMLLFRISVPSISKIMPEVCDALVDALKDWVKVSTENNLFTYLLTVSILLLSFSKL
jgi:hypothetical protein